MFDGISYKFHNKSEKNFHLSFIGGGDEGKKKNPTLISSDTSLYFPIFHTVQSRFKN